MKVCARLISVAECSNVNLIGGEIEQRLKAAKKIAGKIRERDGGMHLSG